MAAENAAIGVQFVQHDVAQIFEEAHPFGVVRQNAGVQHVRVGENHVAALANGFARVAGRVAVIGEDAEAVIETRSEIVQFGELVLRQRLGGKEIQRARVGIFKHGVQHGQVVAKRLARSSGRNDNEILAARAPTPLLRPDANKAG